MTDLNFDIGSPGITSVCINPGLTCNKEQIIGYKMFQINYSRLYEVH